MSNILFPTTILPGIRKISLSFLCTSKRLLSANSRYVKLGASPKQLTYKAKSIETDIRLQSDLAY